MSSTTFAFPRLAISTIMSTKKIIKVTEEREVTLDGMMTIGKSENNLIRADFGCCEDVEIVPVVGRFKVQMMHNGDIYMQQIPKRIKNKPKFREDNSSLSHGRDGFFYYVFRIHESEMAQLPSKLIREASAIAAKFIAYYFKKGGKQ